MMNMSLAEGEKVGYFVVCISVWMGLLPDRTMQL
jgi:hypothetical protein